MQASGPTRHSGPPAGEMPRDKSLVPLQSEQGFKGLRSCLAYSPLGAVWCMLTSESLVVHYRSDCTALRSHRTELSAHLAHQAPRGSIQNHHDSNQNSSSSRGLTWATRPRRGGNAHGGTEKEVSKRLLIVGACDRYVVREASVNVARPVHQNRPESAKTVVKQ